MREIIKPSVIATTAIAIIAVIAALRGDIRMALISIGVGAFAGLFFRHIDD
jgi:hypothetical protein